MVAGTEEGGIERVLVVTAHPDDVDFGAAGTIATWRAAGIEVTDVTFLGYPDGYLEVTLDLRRDIARQIRRFRPQRVVTQSPERNWTRVYASHPDHMAAGEATLRAVYPDARNPFWSPELLAEGFAAWSVPEVWIMGHHAADVVVDVTAQVEHKFAAVACHASQLTTSPEMRTRVEDWMRRVAVEGGLAPDRAGEAFLAVATA